MILFDEKIVGAWFVVLAEDVDWLAGLREITPDSDYEMTYRFRYYKDEKPFDSTDEKSWYELKAKGTRAYMIASVRLIVQELIARSKLPKPYSFELLNDGDLHAFMRKWQDAPFVFARMEGKART
ncbi:MAG TPA: hypothetical protein VGP83_17180 [Pyrinomonadaceae bacterium]|jgi:hypothetical protein|nr:hypothetical protein [Pyrinomonadaceae bacterium]